MNTYYILYDDQCFAHIVGLAYKKPINYSGFYVTGHIDRGCNVQPVLKANKGEDRVAYSQTPPDSNKQPTLNVVLSKCLRLTPFTIEKIAFSWLIKPVGHPRRPIYRMF